MKLCENMGFDKQVANYGTGRKPPRLAGYGNDRSGTGSGSDSGIGHDRDRRESQSPGPIPGVGGASERHGAGCHGWLEQEHPWQVRPHWPGQGLAPGRRGGGSPGPGLHGPMGARPSHPHVRQFHRPGPAFHGPLHAQAGRLVPLPQPGCEHPQGTVPPLAPGYRPGAEKEGPAHGPGRYWGIHRGTALLPGAFSQGLRQDTA